MSKVIHLQGKKDFPDLAVLMGYWQGFAIAENDRLYRWQNRVDSQAARR